MYFLGINLLNVAYIYESNLMSGNDKFSLLSIFDSNKKLEWAKMRSNGISLTF